MLSRDSSWTDRVAMMGPPNVSTTKELRKFPAPRRSRRPSRGVSGIGPGKPRTPKKGKATTGEAQGPNIGIVKYLITDMIDLVSKSGLDTDIGNAAMEYPIGVGFPCTNNWYHVTPDQ